MAERINKGVRSAEEAERHARVLQEIEAHIEGMEDVRVAPLHPTHTCVRLWSPGIVAISTSTVLSPVCLYCLSASSPFSFYIHVLSYICLRPCVPWPDSVLSVDGMLLPLAWPMEWGQGVTRVWGGGKD